MVGLHVWPHLEHVDHHGGHGGRGAVDGAGGHNDVDVAGLKPSLGQEALRTGRGQWMVEELTYSGQIGEQAQLGTQVYI